MVCSLSVDTFHSPESRTRNVFKDNPFILLKNSTVIHVGYLKSWLMINCSLTVRYPPPVNEALPNDRNKKFKKKCWCLCIIKVDTSSLKNIKHKLIVNIQYDTFKTRFILNSNT